MLEGIDLKKLTCPGCGKGACLTDGVTLGEQVIYVSLECDEDCETGSEIKFQPIEIQSWER